MSDTVKRRVLHKHKTAIVTEGKLGRFKMDGCIEWDDKEAKEVITLDPRMSPRRYLVVLIHEHLHRLFPDWTEAQVDRVSRDLGGAVWKAGYRKISR